MSRKRKSHSSRSPSRQLSKQPISLETAQGHLASGRFRDAIAGFKELLKADEDNLRLTAYLADAYAGRANQLSAKGMSKEALVIWDNRAALGAVPVAPKHAMLLLKAGRTKEFGMLVRNCTDARIQSTLRTHVAAHYLAGKADLGNLLAADDPVLLHGEAARTALDAYCQGDDATLSAALSKIPFRSPYRDLVQVLKALIKLPGTLDEASNLLERVDDTSGFANLASAVRCAIESASDRTGTPQQTGDATAQLFAALCGWTAERQRLLRELQSLGNPVPLKGLLKAIYRHRSDGDNDWIRPYGLRLLFPGFPSNSRWLREVRGLELAQWEVHMLAAWDAERDKEPWDMIESWQACAQDLEPSAKGNPGKDDALRVALMLRRAAQEMKLFDDTDPEAAPLTMECAQDLERSLAFDPDDRDTYLQLIRYRIKTKALKQARTTLKDAQARWPKDKQVLTVAIETALAGNAFKKAADIARSILAVDPINSGVRALLVDSHLAHARKNLRKDRPDLAEKSLQEAREWARSQSQTEQLDLVAAFAALTQEPATGIASLRGIAERLGNGLSARLTIALEADRSQRPIRGLLKRIDLDRSPSVPELADLLDFLERLRARLDDNETLPREIRSLVDKPLKAASSLPLEKIQYESACETLERAKLDEVRRAFAQAALKRWHEEPLFELHAIAATKTIKSRFYLTDAEEDRLERAMARARDRGDMRIAHRILELLNSSSSPFFPSRASPSPFFAGRNEPDDTGAFDILNDVINSLDPDVLERLIGSNHPIGEALGEMEGAMGEGPFAKLLESMMDNSDDDPFANRPAPRPRKRRGRKPQAQPKPSAPREDPPTQLDLPDLFDSDNEK